MHKRRMNFVLLSTNNNIIKRRTRENTSTTRILSFGQRTGLSFGEILMFCIHSGVDSSSPHRQWDTSFSDTIQIFVFYFVCFRCLNKRFHCQRRSCKRHRSLHDHWELSKYIGNRRLHNELYVRATVGNEHRSDAGGQQCRSIKWFEMSSNIQNQIDPMVPYRLPAWCRFDGALFRIAIHNGGHVLSAQICMPRPSIDNVDSISAVHAVVGVDWLQYVVVCMRK